MIPNRSHPGAWKSPVRKRFVSQIERREQMKETLTEMYNLLEQYAPNWYPERLHDKAESVLQLDK